MTKLRPIRSALHTIQDIFGGANIKCQQVKQKRYLGMCFACKLMIIWSFMSSPRTVQVDFWSKAHSKSRPWVNRRSRKPEDRVRNGSSMTVLIRRMAKVISEPWLCGHSPSTIWGGPITLWCMEVKGETDTVSKPNYKTTSNNSQLVLWMLQLVHLDDHLSQQNFNWGDRQLLVLVALRCSNESLDVEAVLRTLGVLSPPVWSAEAFPKNQFCWPEFFHCLQMLVFLSVLFLALHPDEWGGICCNSIHGFSSFWFGNDVGESMSPCLEQVGCWVGLRCQCSLHELAEGQVSSSWSKKRYAKTGWKHWKRETFQRQLPEWSWIKWYKIECMASPGGKLRSSPCCHGPNLN